MGNESHQKSGLCPPDKREAIVRAAFGLFVQKGPQSTTTTEIAHTAGISVGTLYKYYRNKKSLFLDMYELYFFKIAEPIVNMLKNPPQLFKMSIHFEDIIDSAVKGHNYASKHIHDMMMALVYNDEDYKNKDRECKLKLVDNLVPLLNELGFSASYPREKIHFILEVVELYAHEVAYKETEGLEYEHIKETIIKLMKTIASE